MSPILLPPLQWVNRFNHLSELTTISILTVKAVITGDAPEDASILPEETQIALDELLEECITTMGADKGNVQIMNPQKTALRIIAHSGFDQAFLAHFQEVTVIENLACARALRSGEPEEIEDVESDILFAPYLPTMRNAKVRAVQSIPLFGEEEHPIGVLSVHFCKTHHFTKDDLTGMRSFAIRAGDILQSLTMQAELSKLNDELEDKIAFAYDQAAPGTLAATTGRGGSPGNSQEKRSPWTSIISGIRRIEEYQAGERDKRRQQVSSSINHLRIIFNSYFSLEKPEKGNVEKTPIAGR